MNAAIVFMLLFAAVYCHPVKRSASSSESAEVTAGDAESWKISPVPQFPTEVDDDDDDDDDDSDIDNDSDESDETGANTSSPPIFETTLIPIIDSRGDNIGYQSGYKKPNYAENNNIQKGPSSYKSYGSDKSEFDGVNLNLYKALQMPSIGQEQEVDVVSGTNGDYMSEKSALVSSAIPCKDSDEDSQSSEEQSTATTQANSDSSESSESKESTVVESPHSAFA